MIHENYELNKNNIKQGGKVRDSENKGWGILKTLHSVTQIYCGRMKSLLADCAIFNQPPTFPMSIPNAVTLCSDGKIMPAKTA